MSTQINVSKKITVKDEAVLLTSDVNSINFTGTGITATTVGNDVTVTVPGSSGGVTSVTGTAPVVSSGGTTPAISMGVASGLNNGYLANSDWTSFNNKQSPLVSGTNIKTINSTTILGSGDLNIAIAQTGHLAYGTESYQYSNTINAGTIASTAWSTVAGSLGLTPFTPRISFTTSSFSVLSTTYGTNLVGGKIVIYASLLSQKIGQTVTKQSEYNLNIAAAGIATVTASFSFTAGYTYWIGWLPTILLGTASTMVTCAPGTMNTINSPTGLVQNIGYLIPGVATAPTTISLTSTYLTNSNITQVWFAINSIP